MSIREFLWVIVLVVVLQLCLGVMMYFLSPSPYLNLANLAIAIVIMATVAGSIAVVLAFLFKRYATERTLRVAMMTLTEDERRVLEEIIRRGEVRQDELRRKVDMSKSKLSALVNNLEQKGAVLKLRYHKTNLLRPTKEFGGR
jgi:uncharacterized membrane protein